MFTLIGVLFGYMLVKCFVCVCVRVCLCLNWFLQCKMCLLLCFMLCFCVCVLFCMLNLAYSGLVLFGKFFCIQVLLNSFCSTLYIFIVILNYFICLALLFYFAPLALAFSPSTKWLLTCLTAELAFGWLCAENLLWALHNQVFSAESSPNLQNSTYYAKHV